MKKVLITIIFLQIISFSYSQEIQIGETLKSIMQNIKAENLVNIEDLNLWEENQIYEYEMSSGDRVLLSMNYYPFGVLTKRNGDNIFLLDFDGDSYLDIYSNYLYVPPWVISKNSTGIHSGELISQLLELSSIAFQSDEMPADSKEMIQKGEKMVYAAQNLDSEDRVFVYLDFLFSYLYNNKEYDSAYYCLQTLYSALDSIESRSLFIFMLELAFKREEYPEAIQINKILLEKFPDFIPGLVYQYILELNLDQKENYREDLITKYSTHWMVINKVQ